MCQNLRSKSGPEIREALDTAQALSRELANRDEQKPPLLDSNMADFFSKIDGLQLDLDKSKVLTTALIDCLHRWGILVGCPIEDEASRIISGFESLADDLEQSRNAKYAVVMGKWKKILAPALSSYMARDLDSAQPAR